MISLATVVALSSGLWAESVPAQTGLPPIPPDTTYAVSPPASGQQYLVYVNGNSPLLLDQIRLVEPEAFLTTIEGRSVIQVGRFNDWNNAQNLVNDLSGLGVGAQIQTAAAVIAPAAPVYPAATGSVAVTATDLPPLPVTAAPPVVDFGQAPTPPGSTSPTALPTAPPTRSTGSRSGYYVVIPAAQRDLPSLAQQVTRLGAPANLVQMRQAPRGTHVAVGPFDDRGIAEDWSRYLAETGLDTRVHYE
ncbi:MAG: hypothetical protein HC812_07905 [Leptolyngbya sp. RL_3_1]|nr:hypothetical protein [Leptolyngbya sp. RL_3_1]